MASWNYTGPSIMENQMETIGVIWVIMGLIEKKMVMG